MTDDDSNRDRALPDTPSPELIPGVTYGELVATASRHRTEVSFRGSAFYREHGATLEQLLRRPRVAAPEKRTDDEGRMVPGVGPTPADPAERDGAADRADPEDPADPDLSFHSGGSDSGAIRVLAWNIEKGRDLDGIIRRFREDSWMRRADLLLLSEVDCGTARGGNVDEARRLSDALHLHHAWLPTFVELTKGTGVDLVAKGENTLGLHGLAILSRWPILAARAAVLPSCHDYFDFAEKRIGGRRGLFALIAAGDRPIVAATAHLEVRRTPRCRERQFAAFLRGLEESLQAWRAEGLLGGGLSSRSEGAGYATAGSARRAPVVLGGDWNTNTFRRGTLPRALVEFARVITTPPENLAAELVAPFSREPLFQLLTGAGFTVAPCNESAATVSQDLGSVEDLAVLPPPLARLVDRTFGLSKRVLRMRLDWIAARSLEVAGPPVTLSASRPDGSALSDHAAIGVDLRRGGRN